MGNYIDSDDLDERMSSTLLAAFINDAVNQTTIVTGIIARAEGRVDGYLSARYETPVTATDFVKDMTLAVAEWEIYKRGKGPVPDKIRQSYEDALADLRAIAKGLMDLGSEEEVAEAESGLVTDSADALFDDASMEDADW